MALAACKDCGKEISKSAKACPNCGYKPKRTGMFTWIVAIFIAVPTLMAIISGASSTENTNPPQTPDQIASKKSMDEGVQRATGGAMMLKSLMRNPDSFKLESALVIEGTRAVCYDYRAQNGFGGMNAGKAVISRDATQFKTADMDGFAALWNHECANKSGQDVAIAIRQVALKN